MAFNNLLQDKRVRSEQVRYEAITRQRAAVISKYKRVYQEFLDLEAGLDAAKKWYNEMKDTVNSLDKNVETFVNNRRSEGAQLLHQIEQEKAGTAGGQADRERERLRGLMERMSVDPSPSPVGSKVPSTRPMSLSQSSSLANYPTTNFMGQYHVPQSPPPPTSHAQSPYTSYQGSQPSPFYPPQNLPRSDNYGQGVQGRQSIPFSQTGYDPGSYLRRDQSQPTSPPPNQQQFAANVYGYQQSVPHVLNPQHTIPPGYVPPPPPPGPPPLGPQQTFPQLGSTYTPPNAAQSPSPNGQHNIGQQQVSGDPWAGLNTWK